MYVLSAFTRVSRSCLKSDNKLLHRCKLAHSDLTCNFVCNIINSDSIIPSANPKVLYESDKITRQTSGNWHFALSNPSLISSVLHQFVMASVIIAGG